MTQHPIKSRNPRLRDPIYLRRVKPVGFYFAAGLVIVAGLIELVMLCSVFYLRSLVVTVGTKPPHALNGHTAPVTSNPPSNTNTVASNPLNSTPTESPFNGGTVPPANSTTDKTSHEIPSSLTIRPNIDAILKSGDKLDQINDLLDRASHAEGHHQTEEAEELLHKAESIDPRSLPVLEALAKYYAANKDAAVSCQFWQRLVDQGPEIGSIFSEASDQLRLKGTVFSDPLRDPSPWPRGIYIRQVVKSPVKVEDENPVFHLRVDLILRNIQGFDQKKLRPFVIFYQTLKDGTHKVDPDQKAGTFEHAFLFQGTTKESFDVTYTMPDPGGTGQDGLPSGDYYGFIIGIYYDGTLQDARSEPTSLWIDEPLPPAIDQ